jgi:hypothetical protein
MSTVTTAHSILFKKSGANAYKSSALDFYLFPKDRPVILPAKPEFHYVEVPGMSGSLDYTEALTDSIVKSWHTGTWDFLLWDVNNYGWTRLYSALLEYFDGDEFEVYLNDDSTHKYKGHVRINDFKSPSPGLPTVQLSYDLIKM